MKRLTIIKQIIGIGILGLVYLAFFRVFHFGIPCIFRMLTGYKCPGCGMTHALAAICEGDFTGAFQYNMLSITVLPLLCLYLIYRLIWENQYKAETNAMNKREQLQEFGFGEVVFLMVLFMVVLAYWFVRNIA